MREKVNQLFKDKFVLVMLVLGLLTIVAAAGAVKIRRGSQYMEESRIWKSRSRTVSLLEAKRKRPPMWREAPMLTKP